MDKYEYKIRSEEIKALIAKREFVKAMEIADTINWTRVRSVSMLCRISDLYKINRRYKEAKELLMQAYEKYPGGRTIIYSLCEICIKTDDIVRAIEYYKEYVQLAPTDNGKFVLQYKIYEAQEVSLEERIAVLEELKKREYREKWGYELAYLYHRIGLVTKCVEECDELILWFREGKYVKKAMELKMLHQALSRDQEALYKRMLQPKEQKEYEGQQTIVFPGVQHPVKEDNLAQPNDSASEETDIRVKTMDVGKYNTINLQKELAESMKDVLVAENGFQPFIQEEAPKDEENEHSFDPEKVTDETEESLRPGSITEEIMAPMMCNTEQMPDLSDSEDIWDEETPEADPTPQEDPTVRETPVTVRNMSVATPEAVAKGPVAPQNSSEDLQKQAKEFIEAAKGPIANLIKEQVTEAVESVIREERPSIREIMNQQNRQPDFSKVEPPSQMGHLLSQEYDGQISLVVPEKERIEKQITGQMNLEEVLDEWEKTKKEIEEKQKEQVKQRVLQQTGSMFTDFDAKVRDGVLEKLEKETEMDHTKDSIKKSEPLEAEKPDEDVADGTASNGTVLNEAADISSSEESVTDGSNLDETITDKTASDEVRVNETESDGTKTEEATEGTPAAMEKTSVRDMTDEEVTLFAPFVQTKSARVRLIQSLDKISLAAYTGNVFVTGESEEEAAELAKNIIREVQTTDRNFSGKVAKVTGVSLNNKDVGMTISKLTNGALIIEKASGMDAQTTKLLLKSLNQEKTGIVVVLQDTKKNMHRMMEYFDGLREAFNVHIEVEELSDDALVAYGKKYAKYLEYAIDEMGMLALHTRIAEIQTSDHIVTVADVRNIVDEAIEHANKKNFKHLTDILFAKRYDEEDMIILRERDFLD